jgi:DNA helicase-2/ATP-dependent DNA helicase PcrA
VAGGRDDLTVVGDASQTIYSFTGATSAYLIDFPRQRRAAVVVRLVRDYRSTPQVVGLANAVIKQARGSEAKLRLELIGQRPPGADPELKIFPGRGREAAAVAQAMPRADRVRHPRRARSRCCSGPTRSPSRTRGAGRGRGAVRGPRRRAASSSAPSAPGDDRDAAPRPVDPGETPLVEAGRRGAVRDRLGRDRRRPAAPSASSGRRWPRWSRWPRSTPRAGLPSASRPSRRVAAAFCDELARRAEQQHAPTVEGVTLASLHSAKGLEWDAVFLVGLADGTLPTTYAKTPDQLEEERRLLYVGVTRARQWLWLSYGQAARRAAGPAAVPVPAAAGPLRRPERAGPAESETVSRRARWSPAGSAAPRCWPARTASWAAARPVRRTSTRTCTSGCGMASRVAADQKVPAYVVFTDATLVAIAERRPGTPEQLLAIAGIGPRKLGQYGAAVFALVGGASPMISWQKTFEN